MARADRRVPRPVVPRIGWLSLQVGGAIALAMGVAGAIVLLFTANQQTAALDASLRHEMARLLPLGAAQDRAAVTARIAQIAGARSLPVKEAVLFAPSGTIMTGRITLMLPPEGVAPVRFRDGESKWKNGRALTARLTDGSHLSVLERDEIDETLREILPRLALTLGAAGALAGIVASWFLARIIALRLAYTQATADAIAQGDLSRRIPLDGLDGIFSEQAISLNRMIARMEEMLLSQRHFASHLAHDLRTPLTRLRALLAREAQADGEDRTALRLQAAHECESIITIFDALLRLSEIEVGNVASALAPVALSGLIGDVAETMEPVLADAGCMLSTGPLAPATVIGEHSLLKQLFVNLLENIALHTRPGTHATIGLSARDGWAVVTLADDGPGLIEDDRVRVLRPFERGRTTTGDRQRGSGLGLAIAGAIMRLHEGDLELRDGHPGLVVELRLRLAA
jgi:signal transduction histidine kinase